MEGQAKEPHALQYWGTLSCSQQWDLCVWRDCSVSMNCSPAPCLCHLWGTITNSCICSFRHSESVKKPSQKVGWGGSGHIFYLSETVWQSRPLQWLSRRALQVWKCAELLSASWSLLCTFLLIPTSAAVCVRCWVELFVSVCCQRSSILTAGTDINWYIYICKLLLYFLFTF